MPAGEEIGANKEKRIALRNLERTQYQAMGLRRKKVTKKPGGVKNDPR